jgi:hypothetical protein
MENEYRDAYTDLEIELNSENFRLRAELAALRSQEPVLPSDLDLASAQLRADRELAPGSCARDIFYFALIECLRANKLYAAPVVSAEQKVVAQCFAELLHHAHGMTMGTDWNKGTMAGYHREPLGEAVVQCQVWLAAAPAPSTTEGKGDE